VELAPSVVVALPEWPDAKTEFLDGSERTVVRVGPAWVGRGTYLPGWRWSMHVQPMHATESEAHAGYVLSGRLAVRGRDGIELTVEPGQAFFAASGHDAWVVGGDPCVALDFPIASTLGTGSD